MPKRGVVEMAESLQAERALRNIEQILLEVDLNHVSLQFLNLCFGDGVWDSG